MVEATHEMLALARKEASPFMREEWDEIVLGWWDHLPPIQAALAAISKTTDLCIKEARDLTQVFLLPEYSTGHPAASFGERFACGQLIAAYERGDHLKQHEAGMGDMGDVFNAMREHDAERRKRNLAAADPAGWTKHTEYHWSRDLAGHRLDYWPSRNKFQWRGKVMAGDVVGFIKKREPAHEPG